MKVGIKDDQLLLKVRRRKSLKAQMNAFEQKILNMQLILYTPITFIKISFTRYVYCRNRQRALLEQVLCTRNLAWKGGNVSSISSRREKWQVAFKDALTSIGMESRGYALSVTA